MSSSFPISGHAAKARGKLKVYLGYAAGVGKTYQMLEEARAIVAEGVDVVVGYYEPHARPETAALLEGLETVPLRSVEYRGSTFKEMDCDAIVRRSPQIALVDEFPHTNVPGSERQKRWEDVLYLLENGIDVWTTVNVQHLESLNDAVQQISGVQIRETIPDWVVQQASEVVMVDLAPRALLNRLDRGVIYSEEKAREAKQNFFKESNLVALREFALREAAFEVEARAATAQMNGSLPKTAGPADSPPTTREKILVLLTPHPSTAALVRRGKRVADYFKGECMAVAICPGGRLDTLSRADQTALEKHLKFAQHLHVPSQILPGQDVARELASFAHAAGITQIYLSRQRIGFMSALLNRDLIQRITRLTGDVEVTVVANRELQPG
jgi:two-component system sensor histidine kinase KdpD